MTRRAYDEKVIRERGPLTAVMSAKTEVVAVRRASLILTDFPAEVVASALATWMVLNGRAW